MKKVIEQQFLTGERALYHARDLEINDTTFADGESPLKESKNIVLNNSIFKWKYPMWYSENIEVNDSVLLETARSGIWYTKNITFKDSMIEAPKTFRRSSNIKLFNTNMPIADETLWNCSDIYLENVSAKGNYFGMNSKNIKVKNFNLNGNYLFDGGENIEIDHAYLISKDSFWNCRHVVVKNSTIIGEYIGWNSEDVTFINCTIDSNQGFCYMKNLKLINCKLLNTDLAFEFVSDINAEVKSKIDSVKNPISGVIKAKKIKELILDKTLIDPNMTRIEVKEE